MTTPFTTRDQIARLMSADGVSLRLDDAASDVEETDMIDEIIADATEYIWQFLWLNYVEADAAASTWVQRRATYIAAHFLSIRRGNPGLFVDRFEISTEELKRVYDRSMYVPGLNVNFQSQPTVSNFIIDNRGYAPVQRVREDSMGTYPEQRTTVAFPYPEVI